MTTVGTALARLALARITPEARDLFRRASEIAASNGDRHWEPRGRRREFLDAKAALQRALGREPWELSPFDVDEDPPPESVARDVFRLQEWQEALELRELLAKVA